MPAPVSVTENPQAAVADCLDDHRDLAPVLGELDCVGQQVRDDLVQAIGIAVDRERHGGNHRRQLDALRRGGGTGLLRELLAQIGYAHRPHAQAQLAGHRARGVQQVLDQSDLQRGIAAQHVHRAMPLLGRRRRLVQLPEPSLDDVQRGAEFVREDREELILQPVRFLGRFARRPLARDRRLQVAVQLHVLEGQGGRVGDRLQDLHLVGRRFVLVCPVRARWLRSDRPSARARRPGSSRTSAGTRRAECARRRRCRE